MIGRGFEAHGPHQQPNTRTLHDHAFPSHLLQRSPNRRGICGKPLPVWTIEQVHHLMSEHGPHRLHMQSCVDQPRSHHMRQVTKPGIWQPCFQD